MHRRSVRPGEGGAWRRAVVRMWGRAASGRRPTFFEPRVARPLSAHRWRDPFLGRRWQLFSFSWRAASLFKSSFCKIPGHGLAVLAAPIVPPIHGCALAAKEASGPWFCQENEKSGKKAAEYGQCKKPPGGWEASCIEDDGFRSAELLRRREGSRLSFRWLEQPGFVRSFRIPLARSISALRCGMHRKCALLQRRCPRREIAPL